MITKRAKRAQRAHCVKLVRTRADTLMKASEDEFRSLTERGYWEIRAKELHNMADILARDPIV